MATRTPRKKPQAPVERLYPKSDKPGVSAWQQAIDDIVASVLADEVFVEPFTFVRRNDGIMTGIKRIRCPSMKRLKKREASVRRALINALPEAVRLFQPIEHAAHGKGCRCRAYCLLRVNAMHVAKATGEDPYELALDGRDMFDAYMMDRN